MSEPAQIWVVDDDRSVRFVLAAALSEAGYRVSAFADAAFLGQGNGEAGFGHGIHGSRHQRQVEPDVAGQAGGKADITGQDGGMGGNKKDVVEGVRFLDDAHGASFAAKEHYTGPSRSKAKRLAA